MDRIRAALATGKGQSLGQRHVVELKRIMASDQTIAELKRQLGETVDRIDSIQQGRQLSLAGKISKHFKTQSGSLINIVLTASLVAVSLGKLQQKQQHQASSDCMPESAKLQSRQHS